MYRSGIKTARRNDASQQVRDNLAQQIIFSESETGQLDANNQR